MSAPEKAKRRLCRFCRRPWPNEETRICGICDSEAAKAIRRAVNGHVLIVITKGKRGRPLRISGNDARITDTIMELARLKCTTVVNVLAVLRQGHTLFTATFKHSLQKA